MSDLNTSLSKKRRLSETKTSTESGNTSFTFDNGASDTPMKVNLGAARIAMAKERKLKRNIDELERKLATMKLQKESLAIELEKERAKSKNALLQEAQRVEQLKSQVRFMFDQDTKQKELLQQQEQEAETTISSLRKQVSALEVAKLSAEDELAQVQADSRELMAKMDHSLSVLQTKSAQDKLLLQELQSSLSAAESRLRKTKQEENESSKLQIELEVANNRIQTLEAQIARSQDLELLVQSLREDATQHNGTERQFRALLEQVKKLKMARQSTEVLNAQIKSLQADVKKMSVLEQEKSDLFLEREELAARLKEWEEQLSPLVHDTSINTSDGDDDVLMVDADMTLDAKDRYSSKLTVQKVTNELHRLQQEKLADLNKIGELSTECKLLQLQLRRKSDLLTKLETQSDASTVTIDTALSKVQMLERRVKLISKERDGLQKILKSYDEEELLNNPNYDSQRIARISELEESLQQTREELKAQTANSLLQSKQFEKIMTEHSQLTKHLERLESENATMAKKLGRGEFDLRTTKVLHFSENPTQMALKERNKQIQLELKNLKEANVALQETVDVLKGQTLTEAKSDADPPADNPSSTTSSSSSSSTSSSPIVLSSEAVLLSQEYTKLKEEYEKLRASSSEERKRAQRLKEVFRQKVMEFRESCYIMTGYKIDLNNGRYRLRSMYAENETDCLLFQNTSHGLQVLESDFCKSLDPTVLSLLNRFHSIPAFLSQITLDLFSKITRQ